MRHAKCCFSAVNGRPRPRFSVCGVGRAPVLVSINSG